MKKLLLVFVFALAGICSLYANEGRKVTPLQFPVSLNVISDAPRLVIENVSLSVIKNMRSCVATVTFKSEKVDVKMTFTAATCAEAWAAAKKVIDVFI